MGENILPTDSIEYYLKNDKRFLGRKPNMRFKAIDPKTGIELPEDSLGNKKYKITSAYAFLYDDLEISLTNIDENDDNITDKPF